MTTRKENGDRTGEASFLRNTYLRLGWIERSHIPINNRSNQRSSAASSNLPSAPSYPTVEAKKLGVELIRKFFWRPRAEIEHYRSLSLSSESPPVSNPGHETDSSTSEAINRTLQTNDD